MQALNDALSGRNTGSNSPDSEVNFRPRIWSEASIDFEKGEQEEFNDDMAHERRLQLLESAVLGMSDKFDAVLSTLGSRQDDTHSQRADAFTRDPAAGLTTSGPHSPRAGRMQPQTPRRPTTDRADVDDFIQQQLHREEFNIPRADDGKAFSADFFVTKLIPKPYMYVVRPGLNTLKKKLDARATITFHEYVVAFLKMVRDNRANLQQNHSHLLEHLQQVVEDAATRDWHAVREWSQGIFDAIGRDDLGWADSNTIQLDRLRSAILTAKQVPSGDRLERRDMPCRDFNSHSGCSFNKSHTGRTVNFAHICTICFNQVGEKLPLTAMYHKIILCWVHVFHLRKSYIGSNR